MTDTSSEPGSNMVSRFLAGLLHRLNKRHGDGTLRQSLEDVIEEHASVSETDDLSAAERTMLRNLLSYGELRVDDVAVPRADIIAVDAAGSFDDMARRFAAAGHLRLAVYRETLDAIIGLVHAEDIDAHRGPASAAGP